MRIDVGGPQANSRPTEKSMRKCVFCFGVIPADGKFVYGINSGRSLLTAVAEYFRTRVILWIDLAWTFRGTTYGADTHCRVIVVQGENDDLLYIDHLCLNQCITQETARITSPAIINMFAAGR